MNSDKYKLKKTLREETTLPPELSWQNMEKGILDQMDQQTAGPASVTGKKIWINWTIFAAALIVTAVIAFYLGNRAVKSGETHNLLNVSSTKKILNTTNERLNNNHIEESQTATSKTNSQQLIDKSASVHTSTRIENIAANTNIKTVQNKRTAKPTDAIVNSIAAGNPNNDIMNSVNNTKMPLDHPTDVIESTEDAAYSASVIMPSIDNKTQNIPSQENPTVAQENQTVVINQLYTLSGKLKISPDVSMREIGLISNAPTRIQRIKSNFMGVGSGITFLNPQFTSVAAGEKFTSLESSVLSQSFFIQYGRQLGKNWQVTGGLEYAKYWHRFDFVKETITEKSVSNVPVIIHVNAISNDSTFIYGDTIATVKNIRTIRHYNNIEVVSIPLMVSYQKKWNRWSAFSSLGAVFQWKKNATGKTLIADKLIEYGDTTSIHKNFLGLSLRVEGGLSYTLFENISLTGSIWVNQSLSNWSSVAGTTFKPWSVGSNFGLRYRF